MKIVKRDGRTVDYNADKIRIAIGKANNEVAVEDKITEARIEEIIRYIESLDKKRMLVEDIQDIIEFKLMEYGNFVLAKKYIIYRYKRSIIRQSNTTDASILSLLKTSAGNPGGCLVANRQRDVMAGEASKDLAYRLLLPKNVVDADKVNQVKFAKIEHFTEPIIEEAKINLKEMFEKGTVINGIKIESPKSFQSAANILVEIIGAVSSCQTGTVYIDLKDLFKYYDLTYEKKYALYESLMKNTLSPEQIRALSETQSFLEAKTGIQTIFYQLNTITLTSGTPKVSFIIDVNDITSEHEEKVVFEFVKQKIQGIKDSNGKSMVPKCPNLIVNYDVDSDAGKRYDYILKELVNSDIEFTAMSPKTFKEFRHRIDRFNQGSMILNLGEMALSSQSVQEFMEILERNLNCCYEGFLCRNHNLQGVISDKSPIHWMYGAIARLSSSEKIDSYLKKDYSYMMLSVIGFEAAMKVIDATSENKKAIKELIENYVKNWNRENTFEVVISNYYDEDYVDKLFRLHEDVLKKLDIVGYYDSYEFMKENYFKDGFLQLKRSCQNTLGFEEAIESNLIVENGGK